MSRTTSESSTPTPSQTPSTSRSRVWIGLAALATTLLAAAAVAVPHRLVAHAGGWAHGRAVHGDGFDPAVARERLDFVASWVLERVDATPEQEAAVEARLFDALDELSVLALAHGDHREEIRAILTAETVDREALEAIRLDGLATADQATRILTEAVADVAELLDPEQRRELAEMAARFHGRVH